MYIINPTVQRIRTRGKRVHRSDKLRLTEKGDALVQAHAYATAAELLHERRREARRPVVVEPQLPQRGEIPAS